jgi:parvulin-like peptidyl-prolyl isomerase
MRRLALLSLVLGGALLLAACGGRDTVATVEEEPIAGDSVLALRTSYDDEPVVQGEIYRGDLTRLILTEAALQAAEEDFGITGLDDQATIDARLAAPGPNDEAILTAVMEANPDYTDQLLELTLVQVMLREAVLAELVAAEGFLEDAWANDPEQFAQVCARHILTGTQAEAESALARITAGEDFATVADEVSLDTGSPGGQLPCPAYASQYVPPFGSTAATAPIGVVAGPIETDFGWHILIVDERIAPTTFEDLAADPLAYLELSSINDLWVVWFDDAVGDTDIAVRSQIGTWVPEADGIRPPQ